MLTNEQMSQIADAASLDIALAWKRAGGVIPLGYDREAMTDAIYDVLQNWPQPKEGK